MYDVQGLCENKVLHRQILQQKFLNTGVRASKFWGRGHEFPRLAPKAGEPLGGVRGHAPQENFEK